MKHARMWIVIGLAMASCIASQLPSSLTNSQRATSAQPPANPQPSADSRPPTSLPPPAANQAAKQSKTRSSLPQGVWQGSYRCAQGETGARLSFSGLLRGARARLETFPLAHNPNVPRAVISYETLYDADTRTLQLVRGVWEVEAPGYVILPVDGQFSSSFSVFTGSVRGQECGAIRLTKTDPANHGRPAVAALPIQLPAAVLGSWRGAYACLGGQIGAELEIYREGAAVRAQLRMLRLPQTPAIPMGTVLYNVDYDPGSRKLQLVDPSWLVPAPGLLAAPATGFLSADMKTIQGHVRALGCGAFKVVKVSANTYP